MALALVILAFASLLLWWALALDWTRGIRGMTRLARWGLPAEPPGATAEPPEPAAGPPEPAATLSVVIPARNEAAALPASLASLLAQDLPGLEIIVVDDRSEDGSAAVARAAGAGDARLEVLRVAELPAGWLGKNHALAVGAARATGAWLLFTDADVLFAPGALRRALAYAGGEDLDHLALLPRFTAHGPLLAAFIAAFALLFTLHTRPWRAPVPGSPEAIGIGAFALVRRSAYRAIGGHDGLRMRVDDDLSLGRALKRAGFRQEAAFGADLVSVAWYADVPAGLRGLEKNAFAGLGFSRRRVALVVGALLLTNVLPFVLLPVTLVWGLVGGGLPWLAALGNALIVLTVAGGYAVSAPRFGHRASSWAWHPAAVALLCWAAVASAVKALRSGEIEWRGTRYPLREVRGWQR